MIYLILVGANSSNKQRLISFLLQKKILTEKVKVLYLDTELFFPCSFLNKSIGKLCSNKLQKYKDQLLNSFIICRLSLDNDIANFIEKELSKLLTDISELKIVVIDNLTHFISNQKKKNSKLFIRDLFHITKQYNICLIYLNDLVYRNQGGVFSLEINYGEMFSDFVNHCIYLNETGTFNKVMQCSVVKSNYYPLESFHYKFDLNNLTLKILKTNK